MTQKVKYIDLVFENVQSARLYPPMFYGLWIDGITKSYMVNCAQSNGVAQSGLHCTHFTVTITKLGLVEAKLTPVFDGTTLQERLKHQDITHVKLVFKDGAEEYIGVPWWSDDDFTNKLQKHTRPDSPYPQESEGLSIKISERVPDGGRSGD